MKGMERRAHAGQDYSLELSFLETCSQVTQLLQLFQAGQRALQRPGLIENVPKIFAFDYRKLS